MTAFLYILATIGAAALFATAALAVVMVRAELSDRRVDRRRATQAAIPVPPAITSALDAAMRDALTIAAFEAQFNNNGAQR